MIAIVCGGRDYTDAARVKSVLDAAVTRLGLEAIIEGGNGRLLPDGRVEKGADLLALEWAKQRGDISWIDVPADWDGWAAKGRREAAGPVRNALMLDILLGDAMGSERAVIAFPGGSGTANMLTLANSPRAQAGNVRVIKV